MQQFRRQQFLPINREKAWRFFSSPVNLSVITPAELDFKIISTLNEGEIFEGMEIDYTVRPLLGIKMNWKTEISQIKNQQFFTDKQVKGPYKVWEHTHIFEDAQDGVLMTDIVNYELPFGVFGKLIERLVIRNKIHAIFDYRKLTLEKMFI